MRLDAGRAHGISIGTEFTTYPTASINHRNRRRRLARNKMISVQAETPNAILTKIYTSDEQTIKLGVRRYCCRCQNGWNSSSTATMQVYDTAECFTGRLYCRMMRYCGCTQLILLLYNLSD